jgi:hypothetical protein
VVGQNISERSADRLGERGSLGEVPLRVGESPRPRLDDPEIQQRDPPQLTAHRDRFARFVCDRSVEQIHLLDYFNELPATPCQRQPQRRDCHRQVAAASRRPVAGRERLSHGLDDLSAVGEPPSGAAWSASSPFIRSTSEVRNSML